MHASYFKGPSLQSITSGALSNPRGQKMIHCFPTYRLSCSNVLILCYYTPAVPCVSPALPFPSTFLRAPPIANVSRRNVRPRDAVLKRSPPAGWRQHT
jgi:hypothetical protein